MIRAGRRDRKITIERDSGTTRNAIGSIISNWVTLRSTWVEVIPTSGNEAFRVGADRVVKSARFVMPFFSDLTEKDRIVFDSQNWGIVYIREIGRREATEVLAQVAK